MTREEGIQGYARMNKAYNEIFDALQDLMEVGFDDDKFISCVNYSLRVLDEGLDHYKDKYVSTSEPKEKSDKTAGFKVMKSDAPASDEEEKSEEQPKEKKLFQGFKVLGGKKK